MKPSKDNDKNNRLSAWLFCIALLAYGLIFSEFGNWNTTSRIGLSVSLADHGSLLIDDFAPFTWDKATLGDHFASSKAPGVSLLALPAVAVAVRVVRFLNPHAEWVTEGDQYSRRLTSHLKWVERVAALTT